MAAMDSPRWCADCSAYGDHHTDRHPKVADNDDALILMDHVQFALECGTNMTPQQAYTSSRLAVEAVLANPDVVLRALGHRQVLRALGHRKEDCGDRWVCCVHAFTAEERARQ